MRNFSTSNWRSALIPAQYRFRAHSWFSNDHRGADDELADVDPMFFMHNRMTNGRTSFTGHIYHPSHFNAANNFRRNPRR